MRFRKCTFLLIVLIAGSASAIEIGIEARTASLQFPWDQTSAFSDYHGTGGNPAANASLSDSAFVANRFRVLVQQSSLSLDGTQIRVSLSIGATLAKPGDTIETLVKRADLLMYRSKAAGRNRVTMSS